MTPMKANGPDRSKRRRDDPHAQTDLDEKDARERSWYGIAMRIASRTRTSWVLVLCIFVSCSNHVAETPPATAPASSPPPPPAQASAISTDLSQKLQEHLQSGALLRDKPAATTAEKLQKATDILRHANGFQNIYRATPANSPDNAMASQALIEESQVAGYLFAEVGSDYTADGDLPKAREVYWLILRTFTGSAYTSLRQHAESRLLYVDDALRREKR